MFKTILVQIDGGAGQASRLRAAAVLAEMHGAHLVGAGATGISLANYAVLNGGMAVPLSDRAFEALRDDVRIRLDAFIEQAQRLGIVGAEARLFEGSTHDGLLLQSRYADLIVVSQTPTIVLAPNTACRRPWRWAVHVPCWWCPPPTTARQSPATCWLAGMARCRPSVPSAPPCPCSRVPAASRSG
jgi:nucleotide-binding universal stress UspA family protein